MIVLTGVNDTLQVVLDGTVATNQMQCFATYKDHHLQPIVIINVYIPDRVTVQTNNTSVVNFITGPGKKVRREVDFISIYNTNSSPHELTMLFKSAACECIIYRGVIGAGERLQYTDINGFMLYDNAGAIKYTTKNT